MNQDVLRKKVKLLKAIQNISYKEISEYLEINANSFYNYLKGQYDLSDEKASLLFTIISNLQESSDEYYN